MVVEVKKVICMVIGMAIDIDVDVGMDDEVAEGEAIDMPDIGMSMLSLVFCDAWGWKRFFRCSTLEVRILGTVLFLRNLRLDEFLLMLSRKGVHYEVLIRHNATGSVYCLMRLRVDSQGGL